MPLAYLDPYKDDLYGKLRGQKEDGYCKIIFDEGKIYAVDNGYVLACYATSYTGVVRNYKPENPLQPGLVAIPIYSKEYEIRKKTGDKWESIKYQPSAYEKAIANFIATLSDQWEAEAKGFKGDISFLPEGMTQGMSEVEVSTLAVKNITLTQIDLTGKLPNYTPPVSDGQRKGGYGGNRGVSPDEKLTLVKKELSEFAVGGGVVVGDSLGRLIEQVCNEHAGKDEFLTHYFDVLTSVVR